MPISNVRPSHRATIVGAINPVSQGVGSVSTGWVSMALFSSLMAVIQAGVLGASATLDAKLQQATDGSGTGAKDIAGKAITQFTKAGTDDNKQAVIEVKSDQLDVNAGFTHVRLTLTVGTAASLVAGLLFGLDARYDPSDSDAATVDEVIA